MKPKVGIEHAPGAAIGASRNMGPGIAEGLVAAGTLVAVNYAGNAEPAAANAGATLPSTSAFRQDHQGVV